MLRLDGFVASTWLSVGYAQGHTIRLLRDGLRFKGLGLCSMLFAYFKGTILGTPNREPQEHSRNIMEYKDPGRYIPIMYLLNSWGSQFGVPNSRVPLDFWDFGFLTGWWRTLKPSTPSPKRLKP